MTFGWFVICSLCFAFLEEKQGIEGHVILRGIPQELYGTNIRLWGRWMLLFVPILVHNGYQLYKKFLQKEMTLYRYKTIKVWWNKILIQQCLDCIGYVLILEVVFFGVLKDYGMIDVERTILLLAGHSIFLSSLLLWIYSRGYDIIYAFFGVVLGEGLGMILPGMFGGTYAPWYWGMWEYSTKDCVNKDRIFWCILAELGVVCMIYRSVIKNKKWLERK